MTKKVPRSKLTFLVFSQVNAMLQESNEQIKILRDQVQESEIEYDHVKAAKNTLEVKFSNLKLYHDKKVQVYFFLNYYYQRCVVKCVVFFTFSYVKLIYLSFIQ